MIDFYDIIAVMMIKQYRVPGNINTALDTQILCRNILTEEMIKMRKNGEDTTYMKELWSRLQYWFVHETLYGPDFRIKGYGQIMDR